MAGIDYPPSASSVSMTQGAPIRSFEFDFSGSNATLSTGDLTINGVDWYLGGVGASTGKLVNFSVGLSSLVADYNGSKHYVEASVEYTRNAFTQVYSLFQLSLNNATGNRYLGADFARHTDAIGLFRSTANVDGTESASNNYLTYASTDPTRMSLGASGRVSNSAHTVGPVGPARLAECASGFLVSTIDGAQAGASVPFSTDDRLNINLLAYAGGNLVTTATRAPTGTTLTLGTSSITIKKVYVYIGEETIP